MTDTPQTATPNGTPEPHSAEDLGPFKTYLRDSRNMLTSLILVAPLFAIYQFGILNTNGVQNGADFVTGFLRYTLFDGNTLYYVLFNLGLMAALLGTILVLRKTQKFNPKTFVFIVLEGTIYGLLLGALISVVLGNIGLASLVALNTSEGDGVFNDFILSIGAGLYEEFVFRLVLLGGSVWVLTKAFKLPLMPSLVGAVLVTSVLFSGIHYVGNMADDLELYSFMFRFIAGIIFAGIYYVRGFAVAVYTHAIYDVIVTVF